MEEKDEERVVGGKRPSIAEMKAEMYVHCIMFLLVLCMFISSSVHGLEFIRHPCNN